MLGTFLGLALGISHFEKKILRWLVTGYSLVCLPWMLSRLVTGESTALGQLASLAGRLAVSLEVLLRGEPVTDGILFVSQMCLLFWFIGIFCGFQSLRRLNALSAVLPATLPLLVVQYYDGAQLQRLGLIGFYFLVATLVIGRINLLNHRERWKARRVFAGSDPEFDLSRGLVAAALLIVITAWIIPTPATAIPAAARLWQEATRPYDNLRKKLDDMLAALQGGVRYMPGQLFGSAMSLGRSAIQDSADIFTVRPSAISPTRFYWRVRTYDQYENGRWFTSPTLSEEFSPAAPGPLNPGTPAPEVLEFVFNWKAAPASLLVTPADPLWLSRTGSFQYNPLRQDAYDLLSWAVSPALQTGDQYRVQAAAASPSIKALRAARGEIPAWVQNRYLQLPNNLSDGIRRLSRQLTEEQATPYDQTAAVTAYLRDEMTYNLTIPAPPPGIDPVDWFLFTWKSGFCNYYASAEVLLLRAAGIPARLVVGYAPGTYQKDGAYKISAKDTHAWPEVYFPEIGWVEFEPTSNQAAIFRPSGEEQALSSEDDRLSAEERMNRANSSEDDLQAGENAGDGRTDLSGRGGGGLFAARYRWLWVIIFIAVGSGAVLFAWQMDRARALTQKFPRWIREICLQYHLDVPAWLERWVRWSNVSAVERAFHAINQSLGWLGKPLAPDLTALERAALLKELLPSAAGSIDLLTAAHEKTVYTPQPADPNAAQRAAWNIRARTIHTILKKHLFGA